MGTESETGFGAPNPRGLLAVNSERHNPAGDAVQRFHWVSPPLASTLCGILGPGRNRVPNFCLLRWENGKSSCGSSKISFLIHPQYDCMRMPNTEPAIVPKCGQGTNWSPTGIPDCVTVAPA